MSAQPIISICNITKRFPGVVALADVSFSVAAGSFHAVVGENGAGKSTLMKILSGVITQYEGEIRLRNETVQFSGTKDAEAAGISIIHQELNLVEELSAAANIFLGREITSGLGFLNNAEMNRQCETLLQSLECQLQPDQLVGTMRVGDQQLIEIAKAISIDTEILIMDEPTSALTESEVERLFRVIARLREKGVTILYISHKMDEVFSMADSITILRDGQLVDTLETKSTNPQEITHLMVGRELEEIDLGKPRIAGEEILKVENLSLPWPGHARQWRLKDISFSLRKGEIVGFAGLMGAGRTELLECLFGASDIIPQGVIKLFDQEVKFHHPAEAKDAGVALVTEDRKRLGIFEQMVVGENISLSSLPQVASFSMVNRHFETEANEKIVNQLAVKTAGLNAAITSLSGGNQQKTIIGRWLLTDPKVLLLDDPTRGVDVGAKAELYRLMDQLCRQGLGVIITSSELPELLTVCDRILVLCEGNLTGEFSKAEATEQKIMEAATGFSG